MTEINISELADKVLLDFKESKDVLTDVAAIKDAVAAEANTLKKGMVGISAGVKLITHVISHIEGINADLKLAGSQKKELAIAIINKLIDLPLLNEGMEAWIIGFVVDAIVTGFNTQFGKKWNVKPV